MNTDKTGQRMNMSFSTPPVIRRPLLPFRLVVPLGLVLSALLLSGCGASATADRASSEADALFNTELPADAAFQLTSPNFDDGDELPSRFSCDSTDISPALRIAGVPQDAAELAIVMDDPAADGGTFVHWIVTGLAPTTTALAEDLVPQDASLARNSDGSAFYSGACPPKDDLAHTYRITVYALNDATGDELDKVDAGEALDAIAQRAVAKATLTATYQRQ